MAQMVLPSGEYRRSTALSGEQRNAYLKHMEIACLEIMNGRSSNFIWNVLISV